MSTATVGSTHSSGDGRTWAPIRARALLAAFGLMVVASVGALVVDSWEEIQPLLPQMIGWGLLVLAADLLPVDFWGRVCFALSFPVALAAGLTLPPAAVGLTLLVATADPREWRGEISWERALFNRSQVTVCVMAASALFHAIGVSLTDWPAVVIPATFAVLLDCGLNLLLTSLGAGLVQSEHPISVLREWFTGVPLRYLLTYLGLGIMALLLASTGKIVGFWGCLAFMAPLAVARQSFLQTHQAFENAARIEDKDRALIHATEQIADERRDERMVVAGELHDEVLPPLYKVQLMAQVLRHELASGRLFELDDDLPELIDATNVAQEVVRSLVGDLRRSTLGAGGLRESLRVQAQELESGGSPRIVLDLGEVGGSRRTQILAYQVGREAMNNAARHSRAAEIEVHLSSSEGSIQIIVRDDGTGFDPRLVNREAHFGLQFLSERLDAAGGCLTIDSRIGAGTTVVASIPLED